MIYPQLSPHSAKLSTTFGNLIFSIVSAVYMWYLDGMDKKYTESELIKYDKEFIISLFLSMQQMSDNLSQICAEQKIQLAQLNQNMNLILEQLNISKQQKFGRSSEKMVYDEQLEMIFNEAEVTIAAKYVVSA